MRFAPTLLLNTQAELDHLRDTALHLLPPLAFESAVVHGEKGAAPIKIEIYRSQRPEYNEKPVLVLRWVDGEYTREG